MCKYIETFHEYSGCRLKDIDPKNGTPTRWATFVRGVTNLVIGQDNNEGGANGDAHEELEPEYHQITEKNILQCEDALRDPKQKEKPPEKRVCSILTPLQGDEAQAQVERMGYTRQTGSCPVCVAVQTTIEEKTNPTVIRKFERGQKAIANGRKTQGTLYPKGAGTSKKDPIRHGTPAIVREKSRKPKDKHSKSCRQM